ncbi:hypothetical protein ACVWWO_005647 [Bradyrhizobium sp. F1.13.1]
MVDRISYSVHEAAKAAGIGLTKLREEIRAKRLVARKLGKRDPHQRRRPECLGIKPAPGQRRTAGCLTHSPKTKPGCTILILADLVVRTGLSRSL